MGVNGSHGPKPYDKRQASTIFLRVPIRDWPAVKRGYKTEFRAGTGKNAVPQLWGVQPPVPVVAYAVRDGEHDARLMVLEELWQEPLGAISPESLRREGFDSLDEFRTYWISRERRRFRPLRNVFAYRVRPWHPEDREVFADRTLTHLYGDWIEELVA